MHNLGLGLGVNKRFMWGLGGAVSPYDPASDAIFASFVTPPTTARKVLIDDCVKALKAAGVWAKLDALYAFAAADSQAAKINWKAPGTFNCTEVNAPAFAADQGFTGASTKYLDSGFNSTTAPTPKYVQDSATIFGWSLTTTDLVGALVGKLLDDAFIIPHRTAQSHFALNQSGGGLVSIASTTALGFFSGSRPNSSSMLSYKDGALRATTPSGSQTSTAPVNAKIVFLTSQAVQWAGQIAAGGFGQSLDATEQTALYNALNAYLAGVGAVSSYQAETNAIAAAFTTPPTTARKNLIDAAVVSLKAAGVWTKLDALYAFAAADSQAAKVNWVNPGTYNCTEVTAPAFTADRGFTGASTKYLDSNFNPATAPSPKLTQNDASAFAWSLTAGQIAGALFAQGTNTTSVGEISLVPWYTNNNLYTKIVNIPDNWGAANPFASAAGFWVNSRTGASTNAYYRNGVATPYETPATASTALSSTTLWFLNRPSSPTQYWTGQIAAGGCGSGLTAADQTALYNALNAYIASVRIFSAFTTPPSAARQTLIQNCVGSLITAGVWDKLDALYMLAAADSQAAKINWKAPGTYNCTEVNAPAFTADSGFLGASTKYIDSNFNPTTATTPNFIQNSSSIFAWSLSVAADSILIGTAAATGTSGESYFLPWFVGGGNYFFARVSSSADQTILNPFSTGLGFWVGSRTGASATDFYRNGGASFLTSATASAAPANAKLTIMHRGGQYSTGTIAASGFGSGLSAADNTALYNALRTYLTGVGVP